jgi:transcription antitermination factor NusG
MSTSALRCPPETNSEELPWYALVTRYRFEKTVSGQLEGCGIATFLPVLKEVHRWSDRRKQVEVPLFPGYAFVRLNLSPASRLQVLRTVGVIRIIGQGGAATPVPDRQIEYLQRILSSNVSCSLHPFLKIGQRVRVRGGCLDGLEGILEQKEQRLVISIDCIERSFSIRIEGYELQLV